MEEKSSSPWPICFLFFLIIVMASFIGCASDKECLFNKLVTITRSKAFWQFSYVRIYFQESGVYIVDCDGSKNGKELFYITASQEWGEGKTIHLRKDFYRKPVKIRISHVVVGSDYELKQVTEEDTLS